MKKPGMIILVTFLTFGALVSPLAAQKAEPPEYTSLVFDERPGAYAIYKDTRFGETAYIGLCAMGGNELALRLYEPGTKNELLVLQTFYTTVNAAKAGRLEVEQGSINLIRGVFAASEASQRLLPMVYNWLNAWLNARSGFVENPDFTFEEDGLYRFQYWVPVLQMGGADLQDEQATGSVKLVSAGFAQSADDPAFFEFTGEPSIVPGPSVAITAAAARSVKVEGLAIPLDANWKHGEDGLYRISSATPQDAYFMVETIDMKDFGGIDTFGLIKLILLGSGPLLADSVRLFNAGNDPAVFYRVYDPVSGQVTVQFKLFVPRDGSLLSIVSLGAYESVYNDNKTFFDSILF